MSRVLLALLALLASSTLPVVGPPGAILIRHDRDDAAYRALGARYAAIMGHVEERAESTLVAPRWALTAAHVVETSGPFDAPYVRFGDERYRVEKILVHPLWEGGWDDLLTTHDLALLKLDRPVSGVKPARLYARDDEHGRQVTILGRGKTGTGLTGPAGDKGTVVRGATNRVDGVSDTVLLTVFDHPTASGDGEATDLEGQGAAGDSGGPALIDEDGEIYVVGVSSAGTHRDGTASYGTLDTYVRVSAFADWIRRTIAADAPPTQPWSRPVRYHGPHARGSASAGALPFPESPVGRVASEFLRALAAGSVESLTSFFDVNGTPGSSAPEATAERVFRGIYQALGVPAVHGWSTAGPYSIRVLFESPRADTWRSFGIDLEPETPQRVSRLYLKGESAPKPEVWR